jgi:hypothetical protein
VQKDLLRYLSGEVNTCRADVIIGRESAANGDYIIITPPEISEPLYQFWQSRNKRRGKGAKSKHTGGNPAYAKLYLTKLEAQINGGMSPEALGACMMLACYLEWDTNYLVIGKGERRRHMQRADISFVLHYRERKTQRLIAELKKAKILERTREGYKFIGLIQKGGGIGETPV